MSYRGTSLIRHSTPTPGPPYGPRHRATVGSYGGVFLDERGTPVFELLKLFKLSELDWTQYGSRMRLFYLVDCSTGWARIVNCGPLHVQGYLTYQEKQPSRTLPYADA